MENMTKNQILGILNDMLDKQIIIVKNSFTGERTKGEVQNIWQWIINMDNSFNRKCKFNLI